MPFSGLSDFIALLENKGELIRIRTFVDPLLEITEITDRITKNNGKALLFENTGKDFPVLINAYGSDKRMAIAIGRENLDETTGEIISLFETFTKPSRKILDSLSSLMKVSGYLPSRTRRKGICQEIIRTDPDLDILPVLKCWPYDGGRFITLPVVHTIHPVTGKTNAGMYRMQIFDSKSTGMHWQLHKTGANHFEAWKKTGRKMPVTVTLGGDPVYAYAATAPLPENIDEYILAGFLRKKKVKLVKCITNDLYIPCDADIVIEGYVDPSEKYVMEGPFGDHTGFYSLADWYPRFHVTCITHSHKAVYPATVVGVPPHEDAWFIKATEKLFLAPIKLLMQPEIEDFHMPPAGVAHNLAVVKIRKTYPGQGKKVISSMFGTGQMMFTKYLVVVSGDVDIRNYMALLCHILENSDFRSDLTYTDGPLDVLDHSSNNFAVGGKLGIDGTIKLEQELHENKSAIRQKVALSEADAGNLKKKVLDMSGIISIHGNLPVAVVGVNQDQPAVSIEKFRSLFRDPGFHDKFRLILAVDHTVDVKDMFMIAWQVLGNSDPCRDIETISDNSLFIDGTIKAFHKRIFPRRWPNVVCSDMTTINSIDKKWESLGCGAFLPSPSLGISGLLREGTDEISVSKT